MTKALRVPQEEIKRLAEVARALGMPVEKMGLVVEQGRIALLPASESLASLVARDDDDELEAWRRNHADG